MVVHPVIELNAIDAVAGEQLNLRLDLRLAHLPVGGEEAVAGKATPVGGDIDSHRLQQLFTAPRRGEEGCHVSPEIIGRRTPLPLGTANRLLFQEGAQVEVAYC